MKKALVLASVASMIDQFNIPNILLLQQLGYEVDVATNFQQSGSITSERSNFLKQKLQEMGVGIIDVPIPRNIFAINNICKSYQQVKKLCVENWYDLVHCHSPIGGAIARLAAKKIRKSTGTKVVYTAHGFHFYKGAPIKNWMFFYPIEKYCSRFTDVLITINQEDYAFASKKMKAKQVEYFPGVGVELSRFSKGELGDNIRKERRRELQLSENDVVLLSVGELNKNKNHSVIIQALAELKLPNVKYLIVGKGSLKEELDEKIKALSLEAQVRLLGYRTDIADLYKASDIFVFPSYREGLSVSVMEAMASGLPCIVSKIRGNVDLIDDNNGGYLCAPTDQGSFALAMKDLIQNEETRLAFGRYNQQKVKEFSIETVLERTKEIYLS